MGERAGCAQAAGPHLKIKKIAAALLNEALGSICPAECFSGTGFSPAGDGSQVCAAPGDGLPKKKKKQPDPQRCRLEWQTKPGKDDRFHFQWNNLSEGARVLGWVYFPQPFLQLCKAKPRSGRGGRPPVSTGFTEFKAKKGLVRPRP